MKKKILAFTLVLTVGMFTTTAFAGPAPPPDILAPPEPPVPIIVDITGSGSIEFQQGSGGITVLNPPGMTTPPGAPNPANVQNEDMFPPVAPPNNGNYATWAVSNLNVDFGQQQISNSNATFYSLLDARTNANRLAGIVVTNDMLSPMYTVSVSVGPFMIGSQTALSQFELTLRKQGTSSDTAAGQTNNITQSTATLSSSVSSINVLQVGTTSGPASATIGGVAAHWSAELSVPGGAVLLQGDAQAVMTWTVTGQTP